MIVGSTMPLPMVAATCRPKNRNAMKLKKAAQTMAHCGLIAPVDTIVAIELAASWKPLRKSNASATTTRKTKISNVIGPTAAAQSRAQPARSCVLDHDAFDDVRHVFGGVGDRLQQLVDRAQLDELLHVGFIAEKARHGRPHHVVCF